VLDARLGPGEHLSALRHPQASLFATIGGETGFVQTQEVSGAEFDFLDPALCGPVLDAEHREREPALLSYLGRVVAPHYRGEPIGRRFVEPGVGRSYLVDFLRVDGKPELLDFSVTGGGVTPYSRAGFVSVGRSIDGRAALKRALHRKNCAERLEEAGARASRVLGIVRLPEEPIVMPDGTTSPAVLIVRGFRSVLRVKQLDPIACFYHSFQHGPLVSSFLADSHWDPRQGAVPNSLVDGPFRQDLLRALDRYGSSECLEGLVEQPLWEITGDDANSVARRIRLRLLYAYLPTVLGEVKRRVAGELGRDPKTEPLDDEEYVEWFASLLGRQLAIFRRLRFLHDYHQEGTSRHTPSYLYTLNTLNVTLMAEFPDLDTGIFVGEGESEMAEQLQLTNRDLTHLREQFLVFHMRDVAAARRVLHLLALIVCHGDRERAAWADAAFSSGYNHALTTASVSLCLVDPCDLDPSNTTIVTSHSRAN